MSKKLQEQIDKIKKSIINKNVTNTSMATYGKLNEIGQSLYRYDQLSKAGLKGEAKTESTKVNNLISNFNATEEGTVFKGYISNTRYVWVAEDGACEDCQAMDGIEYDNPDDAPIPLHPNCKCRIEEIVDDEPIDPDDEPCDCYETVSEWLEECEEACSEYESSSNKGDNALEELQSIGNQIQSYAAEKIAELQGLQDEINQLKDDALEELQEIIDQTTSTIQIFWTNYNNLTSLNNELGHYLKDSAEYYHTKANCEAAQLGDVGAEIAEMLGYLREYTDFVKDFIFKGETLLKSLENNIHDLEVNEAGRKLGKENPNEDPDVIIKKPDGMPPGF